MIEPDWEQEKPEYSEIKEFWSGAVFSEHSHASEHVDEVRTALQGILVNGGCKIVAANFANHPVAHWFVSRNRFDEFSFFEKFLSSEIIRSKGIVFNFEGRLEWEWSSSYVLDGTIAHVLKSGGAYEKFSGTGKEAKALGHAFCEDVFEHRYEEVQVFNTYKPWSSWFYDIAWDQTMIIVDKRRLILWAILLTDTD